MGQQNNQYVEILKRGFMPSFKMLKGIVDNCPEDIWLKEVRGFPYWQQVYHVSFFVDYWLREDYSKGVEFRSVIFDKEVYVELDQRSDEVLTKNELQDYLIKIEEKIEGIFANLTDEQLLEEIVPGSGFTYNDVILSQIRHIQYHVGNANSLLKYQDVPTVNWMGYNEG